MTVEEVRAIIDTELKSEPDITNVFGLDLTHCLRVPVKQKYKNNPEDDELYELWTVLEEGGGKDGYKIYFDEEANMFGLAISSDTEA